MSCRNICRGLICSCMEWVRKWSEWNERIKVVYAIFMTETKFFPAQIPFIFDGMKWFWYFFLFLFHISVSISLCPPSTQKKNLISMQRTIYVRQHHFSSLFFPLFLVFAVFVHFPISHRVIFNVFPLLFAVCVNSRDSTSLRNAKYVQWFLFDMRGIIWKVEHVCLRLCEMVRQHPFCRNQIIFCIALFFVLFFFLLLLLLDRLKFFFQHRHKIEKFFHHRKTFMDDS